MKIAALVVLFNPAYVEITNITTYFHYVDYLFILDNSLESHMDQINKLELDINKYSYIHFKDNIGLCKALNYGFSLAEELGYNWLLVMDSDSCFLNNIIDKYKSVLRNEINDVAVLSPVHIYDRSKNKVTKSVKQVSWSMTSGCLFDIDIFRQIGGFKEELFVDGLDIDYCYKARKHGYRILEVGDALLLHQPGITKEIEFGNLFSFKFGYASSWRYFMQARALIWIMFKYKSLYIFFIYIYKWIKVLLLFDKKMEYINNMLKGTKEGFLLWKKEQN